jgi:hypothetical protein
MEPIKDYTSNYADASPGYIDPAISPPFDSASTVPAAAPVQHPANLEASRQYDAWLATPEGHAASADERVKKEAQFTAQYPSAPAKPPLSFVTMSPDDYAARVSEERAAALDVKAETLKVRHAAEADAMAKRHAYEDKAIEDDRARLKDEAAAIKLYAEMWHRQTGELTVAGGRDVGLMHVRHEAERAKLIHDTGFDVMPPTVGETTRPGYAAAGPGHPWIRSIAYQTTTIAY